jgi:hypothetical protein
LVDDRASSTHFAVIGRLDRPTHAVTSPPGKIWVQFDRGAADRDANSE